MKTTYVYRDGALVEKPPKPQPVLIIALDVGSNLGVEIARSYNAIDGQLRKAWDLPLRNRA